VYGGGVQRGLGVLDFTETDKTVHKLPSLKELLSTKHRDEMCQKGYISR